MTACFADTLYFIAMLNERDPQHARALARRNTHADTLN